MTISIVIPTYNDNYYLNKLIKDILNQNYPHNDIELIIVEAGKNNEKDLLKLISDSGIKLKYEHRFKLSRNKSLNLGFKLSKNDLIVRLDARTHIPKNYLIEIEKLSNSVNCTNVGGVKVPIGETVKQKFLSKIMSNPFCLGGAKFRQRDYEGYADTVYLGCYKRKEVQNNFFFDEKYDGISEDADFNFKLTKSGHQTYISSKIKVYYYCRETFIQYFKLMFIYGVGRGLFFVKNKTFTSLRQIIFPISAILILILLITGFFVISLYLLSSYLILLFFVSSYFEKYRILNVIKLFYGLLGTHIMWTFGFLYSLKALLYNRLSKE